MLDKNYLEKCDKYYLKPGYLYFVQKPTAVATVLGSCVSVCLFDTANKIGGINHYLLPKKTEKDNASTRFGDIAIYKLYKTFIETGSRREDLVAQIIGGAYLEVSEDSRRVAVENIDIAHEILIRLGIKIISQDTGGVLGRKVMYFTETNEVIITKLKKIRTTDFYTEDEIPVK